MNPIGAFFSSLRHVFGAFEPILFREHALELWLSAD